MLGNKKCPAGETSEKSLEMVRFYRTARTYFSTKDQELKDFTTSEELLTFLNNPNLKSDYKEMLRYPSDDCVRCRLNNLCRGGRIQNWLLQ